MLLDLFDHLLADADGAVRDSGQTAMGVMRDQLHANPVVTYGYSPGGALLLTFANGQQATLPGRRAGGPTPQTTVSMTPAVRQPNNRDSERDTDGRVRPVVQAVIVPRQGQGQ